jgi:Spy/CpxP family protein refolding chaperone
MNMKSRRKEFALGGVLAVSLLALLPGATVAQQAGARPQLERQVWARFAEIIHERLGLSDEAQRELTEVLRIYREDREALALREAQLQRRVVAEGMLTARDVVPLLSDEDAHEILAEMEAIRDEERRLVTAEQERLLELLTPSQLVQFYALREALNQRTAGLRQGRGLGPGPGMGRGGPL